MFNILSGYLLRVRIVGFEHGVDRLSFNHQDYDAHAAFTLGSQAVGTGAQFVWNAATTIRSTTPTTI